MSIFRTIAMFIYLFGYMIVHYGVLRRAERALAAGDMQLVEELVNKHRLTCRCRPLSGSVCRQPQAGGLRHLCR